MNNISIQLKTEHRLRPMPKRSPLTMKDAKTLFKTLCTSSMSFSAAERFLDTAFTKIDIDQDVKEVALLSCNSIRNLNDKVIALKDATQNFIQSRPEMKEVQQGYVRTQFKAFNIYLDSFDCQTLSDNLVYIHPECDEVVKSISSTCNGPFDDIRNVSIAVSQLKLFKDNNEYPRL